MSAEKQLRYKKSKYVLGEGSYKTVIKAVDEEEGKEVAYNQVKIKSYEDETKTLSSFSKEIAILKAIDHPNIIKILDYWFTDDDFIFITELMTGGSLKEYIQNNGPLNTKLIRKWGKQILEGLKYLHSLNPPIIHRDIKNDNIFINSATGEIKIGDLGLARERKHKRYTIVGTPHFMAREMFEGEGYTEKVDVYAYGMGLIEMATGKTPYIEFKDTTDIYKSVLQGILPKALQGVTDNCLKSLIMGCLVPSSYRFTSSQCLDHHFFYPDVSCKRDCIPGECVAVFPVHSQPVKDMELSLISINENVITFQILMVESMRFIKFDYDLKKDTVEKVTDELISEKIIEPAFIEGFSSLLSAGIETALRKIKMGHFQDGMIKVNSNEIFNIKDSSMLVNGSNKKPEEAEASLKDDFVQEFGSKTLEEMEKIEEEMKIFEAKEELERKKEEEVSLRLKAKLAQKDASYEPYNNKNCSDLFLNTSSTSSSENPSQCSYETANLADLSCDNLIYTEDLTKALKLKGDVKNKSSCESVNDCPENIYSQFPAVKSVEEENLNLQVSTSANLSDDPSASCSASNSATLNSSKSSSLSSSNKTANSTNPRSEEISLNLQKDSLRCSIQSPPDTVSSPSMVPQQKVLVQAFSKSVVGLEPLESLSSISISEKQVKMESCSFDDIIHQPPIISPPFLSSRLTEEQAVSDMALNESYAACMLKYKNNFPITQYAYDAASITGRTEDTAKSWIKGLRDENIETVFDLKLMVYEDWEKLPLTVFSCRAMQNMLYGIDGLPLKEKQLPMNPNLKEYDNRMLIKDFLTAVCEMIGRKELVSSWENKLMAQDIRTVGELKSLHQEDWNRLGISVFAYRILKNVIFRKGKIMYTDI